MERWNDGMMEWREEFGVPPSGGLYFSGESRCSEQFPSSNIPVIPYSVNLCVAEALKEVHLGVVCFSLSGAVPCDFRGAFRLEFSLFKIAEDFVGAL
jgi:hypothetical protein